MPHFWTKMDWSILFLYFFINGLIASPSLEPGNDYSHINKYYSALFWTWFLMKFIIFDFSVHELALDLYKWLYQPWISTDRWIVASKLLQRNKQFLEMGWVIGRKMFGKNKMIFLENKTVNSQSLSWTSFGSVTEISFVKFLSLFCDHLKRLL